MAIDGGQHETEASTGTRYGLRCASQFGGAMHDRLQAVAGEGRHVARVLDVTPDSSQGKDKPGGSVE
jgi:hypothetical protein